jgi:hypothetical protein
MTVRLLLLLQLSPIGHRQAQGPPSAQQHDIVLRAEDTVLVLRDGRRWAPWLHHLRYHGHLPGPEAGYFVISGFECTDCDAPREIYLLPLMAQDVARDTAYLRFYYPGTVGSEDEPEGFIRSRTFVGACLAGSDSSLVIAESVLGRGKQWTDSTLIVRILHGKATITTQAGRVTTEAVVRRRVRNGHCREIPPIANQLEG